MKKDLEEIDKMIKEALSEEEAAFYDELNELPVLSKLGEVYRGSLGWLAILMNFLIVVLFAGFVYSLYAFINSESIEDLIRWAAAGFLCMSAVGILKLYFWMQMDKNDIKRELKRIELQIAALSSKASK
ncbi:DUF6768 family protein [Robiginitalea sp. IMCC43444]|uniref:DUF6768 family protein n=1 Tax=Robiginitalea sp. IMCC43444 TaxID=3459121 RepID=UPI00404353AF